MVEAGNGRTLTPGGFGEEQPTTQSADKNIQIFIGTKRCCFLLFAGTVPRITRQGLPASRKDRVYVIHKIEKAARKSTGRFNRTRPSRDSRTYLTNVRTYFSVTLVILHCERSEKVPFLPKNAGKASRETRDNPPPIRDSSP